MKITRRNISTLIKEITQTEELSPEVKNIEMLLSTGALADATYFWEISDLPMSAIDWSVATPENMKNTSDEGLRAMLQMISENIEDFPGATPELQEALEAMTNIMNAERTIRSQGKDKEYGWWIRQIRTVSIEEIEKAVASQPPAMDETKRRLRRIIRESLEDESFLAGLLKSGEISMIQQAITLAEDMNMSLLDLPWESVPLWKPKASITPEGQQFHFDLAGIVIDQVESGLIDVGSSDEYSKMKTEYEVFEKLKDKKLKFSDSRFQERVFARTGLQNAALRLLKELAA